MLSIPAKHPAVGEQETLASYWTFYWAVAAAQLSRWLPRRPSRVLDLSGSQTRYADQAANAGHTVVEVRDAPRGTPAPRRTRTLVADGASLGFLGIGIRQPTPEWGSIIADGQNYILSAWWISILPGAALVLLGVALSLIGDGLASVLRPKDGR